MNDEQDTNKDGSAAKLPPSSLCCSYCGKFKEPDPDCPIHGKLPPSFRPAYQHHYGRCARCNGQGLVKGLRHNGVRKKYKCPECHGLGSIRPVVLANAAELVGNKKA